MNDSGAESGFLVQMNAGFGWEQRRNFANADMELARSTKAERDGASHQHTESHGFSLMEKFRMA